MDRTRVVNLHALRYGDEHIYIGRPSLFGNPYAIGRDGTRDTVIMKFKTYFADRIATDADFRETVEKLKGKVLGCYCSPFACHGDVIAKYLDTGEV